MKKSLVLLLIMLCTLTAYSQDKSDKDYYYYNGLENRKDMSITAEQRKRIIEIKRGIGQRYAAIGRDRSLSGYEKGQKKRELSQQIRKEIYEVLNADQRSSWDAGHSGSGSFADYNKKQDTLENDIDRIEDQIDDLEDKYERMIKQVERDESLPKAERKYKKQALKDELKSKKRQLKGERQELKDSRYY